jgi:hypothetical protein
MAQRRQVYVEGQMSDPNLIKGCRLWDKITTKIYHKGYKIPKIIDRYHDTGYAEGDFQALGCRIDGKKAELTVGSSVGHKAHVNLEKKTVDYYDHRSVNNRVMWLLLKSFKLQCKRDDQGVHCKGLTPAKARGVFKAFAMPTSMDFRYSHCLGEAPWAGGKTWDAKCRAAEVKYFNGGPRKEK